MNPKWLLLPGLMLRVVGAADQPQWGQAWTRNQVSAERGLPTEFDPKSGLNLKWSARLGSETHSTPIVAGGRVYVGTNNEQPRDPRRPGDRGVLMCFDERDGSFLWQFTALKLTNSIYWDWPRAGICSAVTVEDERVYLVSNRGEVLCLDARGLANGNDGPFREEALCGIAPGDPPLEPGPQDADILWRLDMITEAGVRQHDSAHTSPLIHGPFLYLNTSNGVDDSHRRIEKPDAPSLVVIEKATGRLVATDGERLAPRVFHSTWSPPALAEVGGRPRLFFLGGDGICYGFEPLTNSPPPGEVARLRKVWQFDPDPDAPKEEVHRFNSNRITSPSNFYGLPVFHAGRLYAAGGGDLWWGKNEAWLHCVDATSAGDTTRSARVWSYPLEKHVLASPAIYEGMAFIADCGRVLHCVDLATGKALWTHEARGDFWSSPLVADGKVHVGTRRGDFWVFRAAREKQLLHTVELGAPMSGSPVAANGTLYVATMTHLYAFQQGSAR